MWFKTFADVVLLFKFRQVFIYNQVHAIRHRIIYGHYYVQYTHVSLLSQDTQNQWVIDATSSAVLRASESLCKTDTIIGLKNDIQVKFY